MANRVRFALFVKLPGNLAGRVWVPLLVGERDRSFDLPGGKIDGILWADLYLGWGAGLSAAETEQGVPASQADRVNLFTVNDVPVQGGGLRLHSCLKNIGLPSGTTPDSDEVYRVEPIAFGIDLYIRSALLPSFQSGIAASPLIGLGLRFDAGVIQQGIQEFRVNQILTPELRDAQTAQGMESFRNVNLRSLLFERLWRLRGSVNGEPGAPGTPLMFEDDLFLTEPVQREPLSGGATVWLQWNAVVDTSGRDAHKVLALSCSYSHTRWNKPAVQHGEPVGALLRPYGGAPGFCGPGFPNLPDGGFPHVRLVQCAPYRGEASAQLSLHFYAGARPHASLPGGWLPVREDSPLAVWNSLQQEYVKGLETAEMPSAVSCVPGIFHWRSTEALVWQFVYRVQDHNPGGSIFSRGDVDAIFAGVTLVSDAVEHTGAEEAPLVNIEADAGFPALRNHGGGPVRRTLRVGVPMWGRIQFAPRGPARLKLGDVRDIKPRNFDDLNRRMRVGALDLVFAREVDASDESHREDREFTLEALPEVALQETTLWRPPLIRFRARKILLHLTGVTPGGEDDAPDAEYSDAVIVLPYDAAGKDRADTLPLYLVMDENLEENRPHTLYLRLQRPPSGLSRLALGRVEAPRFDAVFLDGHLPSAVRINCVWNPDAYEEIGFWEYVAGKPPVWSVRRSMETTRIVLAPQGIGESSVKDYALPAEQHEWFNHVDRLPVKYRFTPPALLERTGGTGLSRYEEPPWNLRRQLMSGALCHPGIPLRRMQFELLYGLSATAEEMDLRLSDVAAPLGGYSPQLDVDGITVTETEDPDNPCAPAQAIAAAYRQAVLDYAAGLQSLNTRLRWLRLANPDGGLADVPVTENLTYAFRPQRKVVYPILPHGPGTILPPLEGYTPADEGGVHGGVDWGFESRAILKQTSAKPSTHGELRRFAAAFLGGTGFQKAEFSSGLTKIYSDTFLGRTFFYSIERLGRIGVFWNKAKHVIIYERSVSHSAQFQEPHRNEKYVGRPVLRKVREFVELLEPERGFPDLEGGSHVPGAVMGIRFDSTIIPVDSKWGSDVLVATGGDTIEAVGWMVPLFRRGARPSYVYTEPNIRLLLAGAPPVDASPEEARQHRVHGRITNPETLVFYTDTRDSSGPNSDTWQAVATVDFPPHTIPQPGTEDGFDRNAPDAPKPDACATPPGYAQFALRVDLGDRQLNLMHGRRMDPLLAKIEVVTCARQTLAQVPSSARPIREAVKDIETIGQAFTGTVEQEIKNLGAALEKAATKGDAVKNEVKAELARLKARFRQLDSTAAPNAWPGIPEIKQRYNDISSAAGSFETLLQQHQAALNGRARAAALAFAEKQQKALLNDFTKGLGKDAATVRQRLYEAFLRTREQLLAQRNLLEEMVEAYERAQQAFAQLERELPAFLVRAERRLEDARQLGERAYREAAFTLAREVHERLAAIRALLRGSFPDLPLDLFVARGVLGDDVDYKTLFDLIIAWRPTEDPEILLPESPVLISIEIMEYVRALRESLPSVPQDLRDAVAAYEAELERLLSTRAIDLKIAELLEHWPADNPDVDALTQQVKMWIEARAGDVASAADELKKYLEDANQEAKQFIECVTGSLNDDFDVAKQAMQKRLERVAALLESLEQLVEPGKLAGAELQEQLRRLLSPVSANAAQAWTALSKVLDEHAIEIELPIDIRRFDNVAGRAMRLLHAHGMAPIAEGLKLNRERLGYYFQQVERELTDLIDITPAAVLFNRGKSALDALDGLRSLSLRVPTKQLAERFLPQAIPHLNLKDILPDVAGLDLSKLLNNTSYPLENNRNLKVTHGINPVDLKAWARCEIDMTIDGERELFRFGPVTVTVEHVRFRALTELRASGGQGFDRSVTAQVTADWSLAFAGQKLVTLEQSELRLDEAGRIKFDIAANRIRMNKVMEFISDLLSSFQGSGSGITFELVYDGRRLPVGARLALNLPLPALQTGAFSVSNIWLRCGFEVAAPNGEFYVGISVGLSDPYRPFTLTILILAGGGWVIGRAFYFPFRSGSTQLSAEADVGLSAGAALPFDIGVARGGVYILASLSVAFQWSGGRTRFDMVLRIMASGEVVILGFVSVYLLIALEARYGNGTLRCTGILELSIKIGWFFEFSVSTSVSFSFSPGGVGGPGAMRRVSFAAPQPNNSIKERIQASTFLHLAGVC